MKQYIIFIICWLTGLLCFAQDILKMKNGDEHQVKVLKVTPSYIEYSYPNEVAVIQVQRKKVSAIQYESGRVEEFEKPKVVPENDVKERKVTVRKDKVKQMFVSNPLESEQMFYVKAGLSLNKIITYDANYSIMGILRRFEESKRFELGEALDIGYSHYIKDTRFYWATELGLTTRGCYYDYGEISVTYLADMEDVTFIDRYVYLIHHGVKMSPAIFGYRFLLPKNFAIDLHVGGYFTWYFAGKMSGTMLADDFEETLSPPTYTWRRGNDDYYSTYFNKQKRINAGIETGIAFWYKRFCFDFTYNVGFISFEKLQTQPSGMSPKDYYDALYNNPGKLDWNIKNKNYNYNIQFKLGIAF